MPEGRSFCVSYNLRSGIFPTLFCEDTAIHSRHLRSCFAHDGNEGLLCEATGIPTTTDTGVMKGSLVPARLRKRNLIPSLGNPISGMMPCFQNWNISTDLFP